MVLGAPGGTGPWPQWLPQHNPKLTDTFSPPERGGHCCRGATGGAGSLAVPAAAAEAKGPYSIYSLLSSSFFIPSTFSLFSLPFFFFVHFFFNYAAAPTTISFDSYFFRRIFLVWDRNLHTKGCGAPGGTGPLGLCDIWFVLIHVSVSHPNTFFYL